MKIEAGHEMYGEVTPITQTMIRFIAEDGRCMFEVSPGNDGRSIEVRGVDMCKVGDALYGSALSILPHVSNSLTIEAKPYDRASPNTVGEQK